MANIDASFGLKPIKHKDGTPYTGAVTKYYVRADYATALFIGDPVVKITGANTAEVKSGTVSHAIGTLMTINKATAGDGNPITGVIVGFEADPDNRSRVHRPASTERVALVCDDPDVLFEIQADGIVAAADVGLNAVLIFTNAGSTVTGLSGVELDTSSDAPAADASNQLTIQGISRVDGRNDVSAANVVVVVKINQHSEADNTIGVA